MHSFPCVREDFLKVCFFGKKFRIYSSNEFFQCFFGKIPKQILNPSNQYWAIQSESAFFNSIGDGSVLMGKGFERSERHQNFWEGLERRGVGAYSVKIR